MSLRRTGSFDKLRLLLVSDCKYIDALQLTLSRVLDIEASTIRFRRVVSSERCRAFLSYSPWVSVGKEHAALKDCVLPCTELDLGRHHRFRRGGVEGGGNSGDERSDAEKREAYRGDSLPMRDQRARLLRIVSRCPKDVKEADSQSPSSSWSFLPNSCLSTSSQKIFS